MSRTEDPFDLGRFVAAQAASHDVALREIRAGRKESHWMWYVFPQIDGLAMSGMSARYAIKSAEEARAYLEHPLLGARLRECAEAVLGVEGRTVGQIFGYPDDLKLRSSATLFAAVSAEGSVFHRVLERYFQGVPDERTHHILKALEVRAGR